jgi:hypothetical protein
LRLTGALIAAKTHFASLAFQKAVEGHLLADPIGCRDEIRCTSVTG